MREIWDASTGALPADPEARRQVLGHVKKLDRHLTQDRVRGDPREATEPLRQLLGGPCLLLDCCLIASASRQYVIGTSVIRYVLLRLLDIWEASSTQAPEMLKALAWHMIGVCMSEKRTLEEKQQGASFLRQALEVYERHPEVRPRYLVDLLLHLEEVLRAVGRKGEARRVKERLEAEQARAGHPRRLRREDEQDEGDEEDDLDEGDEPGEAAGAAKGAAAPPVSGLTPLMQRIWAASAGAMPPPENMEEAVPQLQEMDRHLAAGRERSAGWAAMALLGLLPEAASPLWVACTVVACVMDLIDLGPGSVQKLLGQVLRRCEKNPGWELGRIGGILRHLRGICLNEDQQYKEAEPLLRQALEIYEREPDLPARYVLDLLLHLEAALRGQGNEAEAVAVRARFEEGKARAGGFIGLVEEEEPEEDPGPGDEDGGPGDGYVL